MSDLPQAPEGTIRVKRAGPRGWHLIDASRFDPAVHEVYGSAPAAAVQDEPVLGIGTDSGEQFSDEQLRAAIKEVTGRSPHPATSREKLVAQFNELNADAAKTDE